MSVCEKCWAEARKRHDLGEGESVTEVYHGLVDAHWCSTQGGRVDLTKALTHSLAIEPEEVSDELE